MISNAKAIQGQKIKNTLEKILTPTIREKMKIDVSTFDRSKAETFRIELKALINNEYNILKLKWKETNETYSSIDKQLINYVSLNLTDDEFHSLSVRKDEDFDELQIIEVKQKAMYSLLWFVDEDLQDVLTLLMNGNLEEKFCLGNQAFEESSDLLEIFYNINYFQEESKRHFKDVIATSLRKELQQKSDELETNNKTILELAKLKVTQDKIETFQLPEPQAKIKELFCYETFSKLLKFRDNWIYSDKGRSVKPLLKAFIKEYDIINKTTKKHFTPENILGHLKKIKDKRLKELKKLSDNDSQSKAKELEGLKTRFLFEIEAPLIQAYFNKKSKSK